MANELFVVAGATGNIGKRITRDLLKRGHRVRAIGRNAERLRELVDEGADAAVGSLEDAGFLAPALAGASAVFSMIPPNLTTDDLRAYQRAVADAIVAGIQAAGVTHVVNLSSIGAHMPSGTGPIAGLHDAEATLDAIDGLNVVHLRPSFFMENLFMGIPTIKGMGVNGSMARPDVAIPMIATKDIAAAATDLLERADFTGSTVVDLLGGGDYTMVEATRIFGKAISKPDLAYVQFPYEDARAGMIGMGLSASVVDGVVEMYRALNEGRLRSTVDRTPENTTATTLEDFAPALAAAYNADGTAAAG